MHQLSLLWRIFRSGSSAAVRFSFLYKCVVFNEFYLVINCTLCLCVTFVNRLLKQFRSFVWFSFVILISDLVLSVIKSAISTDHLSLSSLLI